MFCFSDVFFLGPLMYLFDLRGEAARLVYSSTTNVQLKIILLALKSLHLMFKISIMSSKNQNQNKKQTRERRRQLQRDTARLQQSRDQVQREFHFQNKTAKNAKTFRCCRITGSLCSSVRRMKDKNRNYFWQLSCSVVFYCFFKRPFLSRFRCYFFLLVDIKTISGAESQWKVFDAEMKLSFPFIFFLSFFKSWGSFTFLKDCLY